MRQFSLPRALAIFATLTVFTSSLQATEARMDTLMRHSGISDETWIFAFPSTAKQFNLALLELGTVGGSEAYGGAVKTFGDHTFGVFFSRDDSVMINTSLSDLSMTQEWLTRMTGSGALLPTPQKPVDLIYGINLGASRALAFRATYASFSSSQKNEEGETNTTDRSAVQTDFLAGYSMPLAKGRLDLTLGAGVSGDLEQTTETGAAKVEHSYARGLALKMGARHLTEDSAGTRFFSLALNQETPKARYATQATSETVKMRQAGANLEAGYALKLPRSGLVSGALSAIYSTSQGPRATVTGTTVTPSILTTSSTVKRTVSAFVASIGGETLIWENIGLMGGFMQIITGSIREADGITAGRPLATRSIGEVTDTELWNLGMFYRNERLRVDAQYAREALYNGLYFISGVAARRGPILKISAAVELGH